MNRPNVVILAIGNELLRGDVENSNGHWLSRQFTGLGGHVVHMAVVRDETDHIEREFDHALEYRPQLLVTTGGLGPTADDLTLSAIAQATNCPLEPNPEALAMVAARYAELARAGVVRSAELTPSRRKMGLLPRGATPLANRVGAAPGVCLVLPTLTVVCLPGVPKELYHLVETSMQPVLARVLGPGVQQEIVRFANTSDESRLSEALDTVQRRHPEVYLKSHASGFRPGGWFRISISTIAGSASEAQEATHEAEADLAEELRKHGLRLAVDEAEPGH